MTQTLSPFDKLLQNLAGLNGFELEIYKEEYSENQDLKIIPILCEEKEEVSLSNLSNNEPPSTSDVEMDDEDLPDVKFDFDRFLKINSLNVCEGDYELAKMSRREFRMILEEQIEEEKAVLRKGMVE